MLEKVTITGADDSTPIEDLVSLSKEFPFVEWGILISAKSEGTYRFPSRKWIDALVTRADQFVRELNEPLNLSTHICGRWVRQLFVGQLEWTELPSIITISQRVQINTHAEEHVATTAFLGNLASLPAPPRQFIFQWDGVNDHLIYGAFAAGFAVAALFDTSGGAGRLPVSWPQPKPDFLCGYAGGLGPDNVEGQLRIIEQRCAGRVYWIDMERRVRTQDDSRLDLDKVRRVLEICAVHREANKPAIATIAPEHRFRGVDLKRFKGCRVELQSSFPQATRVILLSDTEASIDLSESGLIHWPIDVHIDEKGAFVTVRMPVIDLDVQAQIDVSKGQS